MKSVFDKRRMSTVNICLRSQRVNLGKERTKFFIVIDPQGSLLESCKLKLLFDLAFVTDEETNMKKNNGKNVVFIGYDK